MWLRTAIPLSIKCSCIYLRFIDSFPGDTVVKNLPANAGDTKDVQFLSRGRSPGEENENPLQYSYLGNPMDRGAWWATVHGVTK